MDIIQIGTIGGMINVAYNKRTHDVIFYDELGELHLAYNLKFKDVYAAYEYLQRHYRLRARGKSC